MDLSIFSEIGLPIVIGFIMFNLGLSLKPSDFTMIIKYPRFLITGLICQMILLPALAFLVASLSGLSPEMKTGLVIIAACPGGATSNLITYHLKGDVALSISLTAVNSILILISIPVIVFLALNHFMDDPSLIQLPVSDVILKILIMVLLPTGAGVLIRYRFPQFAISTEKFLKWITTGLLAVVFVLAIFGNQEDNPHTMEPYYQVFFPVLILNILGMSGGYMIARLSRFGLRRQITLAVEVGIQNSALAITIAGSPFFLNSFHMSVPAVVYGLITFFNAVLFGLLIRYVFRKFRWSA